MVTQLLASFAGHAYGQTAAARDKRDVGSVGALGGILPCTDGYVAISPREEAQWRQWLAVMGNPGWSDEERFATRDGRESNTAALWELMSEWSRRHSKLDVARWGQERRVPCFPVNTAEDLFSDPQLEHRQFFSELEHPVAGRLRYPGTAYKLSDAPANPNRRPAPMLGEHNPQLLPRPDAERPDRRAALAPGLGGADGELPLAGVRVVDLSWIIAGPTAARFLAAMGAEVIKVGSARRPDPSSRGAAFQVYNQSKLYCALNIREPEGLALAKELISTADVVIENFAAGVIERLGLGYDKLREERPDVIMVSSSGTGHSGPDRDYVAYGSLLQHYTGWNSVSGHPGEEPIKGGLWADPWVGMELALVTVAALTHRAATGQGQYVDFSMAESLTASIPAALLDYQMSGKLRPPLGNRDVAHAPHNLYRCAGEDAWLAIAVTTDDEWRALCGAIGRPDMADNTAWATAQGRRRDQDVIDAAIGAWAATVSVDDAARKLQDAGVPAAPSMDSLQVYEEPSLRAGGYFAPVTTNDGETRLLPGIGWRLAGGPAARLTAAPTLGQHNGYVYRDLLGVPESEFADMVERRVVY